MDDLGYFGIIFCNYTMTLGHPVERFLVQNDGNWELAPSLKAGSMRLLDPCAKCLDSRYAKDWNKRDGLADMLWISLNIFEYDTNRAL